MNILFFFSFSGSEAWGGLVLAEFSHIPVSCVCTHSQDRTRNWSSGLGAGFPQAEVLGCCHPFAPHAERVSSSKKCAVFFCTHSTVALGLLSLQLGAEGSVAAKAASWRWWAFRQMCPALCPAPAEDSEHCLTLPFSSRLCCTWHPPGW